MNIKSLSQPNSQISITTFNVLLSLPLKIILLPDDLNFFAKLFTKVPVNFLSFCHEKFNLDGNQKIFGRGPSTMSPVVA